MMVRDGSATVARALRPLKGIADEVCFVDTGSTDGTPDAIAKACSEIGVPCMGIAISPTSRPDLYFRDISEEYGPYGADMPDLTGSYLLRDWATTRNLGLEMCRGEWVLKLDADDELLSPDHLQATIGCLSKLSECDFVACPYEVMCGSEIEYETLYTRLWRNLSKIRFREICHENVDWGRREDNWMCGLGVTFRDWRDAGGASRIPHRNLKVLLREYVARKFSNVEATAMPPAELLSDSAERRSHLHLLTYLADEAALVRPGWALEWAERRLTFPIYEPDRAWIMHSKARAYAALDMGYDAQRCYQRAAEMGWGRASLALAVQCAKFEQDGWRYQLLRAIALNQGKYYPRFASHTELREARELLT
jgi:hypothetical protein